jgi:uncharacterized protein YqeY
VSLLEQIDKDLIKALKAGDRDAATTLRGLKSDIKYFQIDHKIDSPSDKDLITVLSSAAKKRRDAIEQYEKGRRDDLVQSETRELKLIEGYLPEQLSEDRIEELARAAISEAEASGPNDIGKVMKLLMPKVKGQADGKLVNTIVNRLLSGK